MSKTVKSRAQWAAYIRAAHMTISKATLKLGQDLLVAKKQLPHGEFLAMIKSDLPFTASTAQRLMIVASDPKIQKLHSAQLLPYAWSTRYELSKVPAAVLEQARAACKVHQKMTRREAVAIREFPPRDMLDYKKQAALIKATPVTERPAYDLQRTQAAVVELPPRTVEPTRLTVVSNRDAAEPTRTVDDDAPAAPTLDQIGLARELRELAAEIERGAITGAAFSQRARSVADQLMAMVKRRLVS